jgi:hypothetical protein
MNRAPELKIVPQVSVKIRFAISPWPLPGESLGIVSRAGAGRFRPASVPMRESYPGEARFGMEQSDGGKRSGVNGRIKEGANPDS